MLSVRLRLRLLLLLLLQPRHSEWMEMEPLHNKTCEERHRKASYFEVHQTSVAGPAFILKGIPQEKWAGLEFSATTLCPWIEMKGSGAGVRGSEMQE